jgi:hypothetical protein
MNKKFLFVISISLLSIQYSCNSPSKDEVAFESSEAMDISYEEEEKKKETAIEQKEQKDDQKSEITEDVSINIDRLNKILISTIKENNSLEKEGKYYERKASIKGTFGDVHFYKGKAKKITFSEEEIGINGQYICFFDSLERLIFISAFDHGNTWYREEYFLLQDDKVLSYFKMGDFSDESKIEVKLKEDEKSWMTIEKYQNTLKRAIQLKQEAIYNQTTLDGTRYYNGSINEKHKVQMQLVEFNDWAYGKYHYEKSNSDLKLSVSYNQDSITITETIEGKKTGIFKGLKNENGEINGFWQDTDKTKRLPFHLAPSRSFVTIHGEVLQSISITPEEIKTYGNQVFGMD